MSDINDYLIDQAGKDWGDLLSGWRQALPGDFTLWMVNRFGDLILVFEDGTVHFLDVGMGQIGQIAESREHLFEVIDQGDNAANWLMMPLVDACRAAGMTLSPEQCYGYKTPPLLGGTYDLDNIELTDLSVHYALLADMWQQTKDLPEGTRIKVVIAD
ncbi:hypothetical protein ABI_16000 [Asticcacaulis biprosthecium C19]|uniref:T6SS immunity protein Tdi1 C-terminal domain-containing protein n=1 Tax=Asticcacaulis biprosthecium C19 TaxID=715226 RepID=F4QJH6_9CAUL|nr:DUF1851 domain-containing protein [Asticcacaulis biprosthecium]EGF93159.1 hypothetical protein ABI_16000 [Asticcacaulis biprosthecium C19]